MPITSVVERWLFFVAVTLGTIAFFVSFKFAMVALILLGIAFLLLMATVFIWASRN